MTDIAVENARRRIAVSEARIREIQNEIQALSDEMEKNLADCERANLFIRTWSEFAGQDVEAASVGNPPQIDETNTQTNVTVSTKMKRPKNPKKEDVASKARELILGRGEPMSRSELFQALRAVGVGIYGSNPEMVLSTMLWRMNDVIVRLPSHGYWPADVANEKVGYDPKLHTQDSSDASTSLDDLLR